MSQTWHLACQATKEMLWVGQGNCEMSSFYSGNKETMSRLGRFLESTRGHPLVLLELNDCEEFEEFEGGEPNE